MIRCFALSFLSNKERVSPRSPDQTSLVRPDKFSPDAGTPDKMCLLQNAPGVCQSTVRERALPEFQVPGPSSAAAIERDPAPPCGGNRAPPVIGQPDGVYAMIHKFKVSTWESPWYMYVFSMGLRMQLASAPSPHSIGDHPWCR